MSLSEYFSDDCHPIDIVETMAEDHDWDFDRVGENQIAMAVEGQWRTYSITLAWSGHDDTLRLIVSFEMEPPQERLPELYEMLNKTNDLCWTGAFTFWAEQKLMVYRYGLLAGEQGVSPEQVATLIDSSVAAAERFYPAFQLVTWGNTPAEIALQTAIAQAYGRA